MELDTEISVRRIFYGVVVGTLLLGSVMSAKCSAQERMVVGTTIASWHSNERYPYETWTPGLYVREDAPTFKAVGAFRNSQGFWSAFGGVGHTWQGRVLDLTLVGGAVYGYRDWDRWQNADGSTFITYGKPKVLPFVLPSVGAKLTNDLTVRTFVAPAVGPVQAWAVSFGIEGRF